MTQAPIDPTTPQPPTPEVEQEYYEDYWGVQETFFHYLPDGKQFFEIKPMDEGAKTRFQKLTNKGIKMNQRSQEATIDVDPSDERHQLIEGSVIGWKIMQRADDGTWHECPVPTDDARRRKFIRDNFLAKMNPKVIQDLEFFIRLKNPWMQDDQDLADLLERRDELDELIKQAREREAGEGSSANK